MFNILARLETVEGRLIESFIAKGNRYEVKQILDDRLSVTLPAVPLRLLLKGRHLPMIEDAIKREIKERYDVEVIC